MRKRFGEMRLFVDENGVIRMITGNVYDIPGICRLLAEAVKRNKDSTDIAYLERCCAMLL